MKTIILGAGITGLVAGYESGAEIYEATDRVGGICRSYEMNGYRFDNGGGHWIFNVDKVRPFLDDHCNLRDYKRNAGVYFNKIMPYPIQGVINTPNNIVDGSMKEWMLNKFGNDMCKMFFFPFNERYTDGLYNSVIQDDEYKSPTAKDDGYNTKFSYPKDGLDLLVEDIAADCLIHYKKKAINISAEHKTIWFDDGESVKYDRIISTIPLNQLLKLCGYANGYFPYTSTYVLNIGATKGINCPEEHWLYVPFSKSGFYRVGFYSNVDKMFAPEGNVSIYVERAYTGVSTDIGRTYVDDVIAELKSWGWIDRVDALDSNWIECGYTWLWNSTNRHDYLDMLADNDIISTGRYGKWKFQGISDSIMDGIKWGSI